MTFLPELWEVWEGRKGDLGGPDDTFGVFSPGPWGPQPARVGESWEKPDGHPALGDL